MASPEDIRSTIATYIACFGANDRARWLDLFAADATVEDPVGSDVRKGIAAIGEFWDFSRSLSPMIELEPVGPTVVAGHEAAFLFRIIVGEGDERLAVHAIDIMTFTDDAKIQSQRAVWDMSEMQPYPG